MEDTFQKNGYVIINSPRKDEIRRQGVAIVIEKELSKCMNSYALTSERIMSVALKTNTGSVTIIQVHVPDSNYDDDEVENFYNILQQEIDTIPKKLTVLLNGDFNARVGTNYTESISEVVGKYSIGGTKERGLRLLQFAPSRNMCWPILFTNINLIEHLHGYFQMEKQKARLTSSSQAKMTRKSSRTAAHMNQQI